MIVNLIFDNLLKPKNVLWVCKYYNFCYNLIISFSRSIQL